MRTLTGSRPLAATGSGVRRAGQQQQGGATTGRAVRAVCSGETGGGGRALGQSLASSGSGGTAASPRSASCACVPLYKEDVDCGTSGASEETCQGLFEYRNGFGKTEAAESIRRGNISSANSGRAPWNAGLPHTYETKKKIRQSLKETYAEKPELADMIRNRQQGKKHSAETRKKIRLARLAHVKRQKSDKERRKVVNGVWDAVLAIQKRREDLYNERKLRRFASKKKKTVKHALKSGGQRKPRAAGQDAGNGLRSKPKSEAHRRKISEAMKKKWQQKEFRGRVQTGIASKNARSKRGAKDKREGPPPLQRQRQQQQQQQQKRAQRRETMAQPATAMPMAPPPMSNFEKVERGVMMRKQEKLRKRANEVLALAHAAAEHLRTLETNGNGGEAEGERVSEIKKALRSLEDADALVKSLQQARPAPTDAETIDR